MSIPPAAHRLIVLGASNVVRGLSTLLATAREGFAAPVDVLLAAGHGRSYGLRSTVLARTLPAIVHCGLWPALEGRSTLPTSALITDVGNDIAYGMPADHIADWVEACLQRFRRIDAPVALTRLPLDGLQRLTPGRFRILRSILFPGSGLTYEEAMRHAVRLDQRLEELAGHYGATAIVPHHLWYGWDPIHVLRHRRREAWEKFLQPLHGAGGPLEIRPSARRWLRLRTARPADERWFGVRMTHRQPALTWNDGTRLSMY